MKTLLLFRKQEPDSTTLRRSTSGVDMHIGAFNFDHLASYSVSLNNISLVFDTTQTSTSFLSTGTKTAKSYSKPQVDLKIRPGFEYKTLVALQKFLSASNAVIIYFDNVKKQFPVENIQEVTLISSI